MIVICNGMPRSASTWSYNVAASLLRRCFPDEPFHGGYDEDTAHFLASAAAADARHVVLKCHTLSGVGRALVLAGAAKVIYTWRDVADAVVSTASMFGGDIDGILAGMRSYLDLYSFHRSSGNALIVSYDEIADQPESAVRQVVRYLGLDTLAMELAVEVAEETSLARMREKVERLEAAHAEGRLVPAGYSAYDPETLLHRRHIRDGRSGLGRAILSPEQLGRIDALMSEYGLKESGYGSSEG